MITSTDTETRLEPTQPEHRVDGLGNFRLIHLAACLGGGGAVGLAAYLVGWLT